MPEDPPLAAALPPEIPHHRTPASTAKKVTFSLLATGLFVAGLITLFGGGSQWSYFVQFVLNEVTAFILGNLTAAMLILSGAVLNQILAVTTVVYYVPSGTGGKPDRKYVWYKPFSFHTDGAMAHWQSGGKEWTVSRELVQPRSIFGGRAVIMPVHKHNLPGNRVSLETDSMEASIHLADRDRVRLHAESLVREAHR